MLNGRFSPDKHKVNKIQNSCGDIEQKTHSTEGNKEKVEK